MDARREYGRANRAKQATDSVARQTAIERRRERAANEQFTIVAERPDEVLGFYTVTGDSGKWGQGGEVSVNAAGWPTELKTWNFGTLRKRWKMRERRPRCSLPRKVPFNLSSTTIRQPNSGSI